MRLEFDSERDEATSGRSAAKNDQILVATEKLQTFLKFERSHFAGASWG